MEEEVKEVVKRTVDVLDVLDVSVGQSFLSFLLPCL